MSSLITEVSGLFVFFFSFFFFFFFWLYFLFFSFFSFLFFFVFLCFFFKKNRKIRQMGKARIYFLASGAVCCSLGPFSYYCVYRTLLTPSSF